MSASGGRREVAFRLFAAEYEDANFDYRESDEERAPNYVVTPAGARANRLFVAGVLTSVEQVNEDMLRGRVSDPTGAFVAYAGQYQPDAEAFLDRTESPEYVAVTGKTRTFRPEDSDRVFTSLRPESITAVDSETRDRWTVRAAEQTLARVATMAVALQRPERGADLRDWLADRGVQPGVAAGVPLAIDHYGTTPAYLAALRERALQAAEVVAGDRDQVEPLSVAPGRSGDADLDALADPAVAGLDVGDGDGQSGGTAATAGAADEGGEADAADASADTGGDTPADAGASEADGEAADGDDGATGAEAEAAPDEEAASDEEAADSEPAAADSGGEAFEMDDEERERIESELGTDFATAGEVDDPGNADIDVPENGSEEGDDGNGDATTGDEGDTDDAGDDGAADDGDGDGDDELEDATVEAMRDLDDGTGAPRDAVVEHVADETGADADAVEEAIQSALMDGRCYEPDDATLKPI